MSVFISSQQYVFLNFHGFDIKCRIINFIVFFFDFDMILLIKYRKFMIALFAVISVFSIRISRFYIISEIGILCLLVALHMREQFNKFGSKYLFEMKEGSLSVSRRIWTIPIMILLIEKDLRF